MPKGMYVTVEKDGKEFDHFIDTPARGFQCFDNVRAVARRQLGKDIKILRMGIKSEPTKSTWEPPPGPDFIVKLSKNKFAFGRKFVPKDVDFDNEITDTEG